MVPDFLQCDFIGRDSLYADEQESRFLMQMFNYEPITVAMKSPIKTWESPKVFHSFYF